MTKAAQRNTSAGMQSTERWRAAWLPLATLFIAPAGYAMDYSAIFNLKTQGNYTNDIRLEPGQEQSAAGFEVTPFLTLRGASETTQVSFDGSTPFKRFNRSNLDTNDQYLSGSISHQFELSTFSLSASTARDSTLTSEALDSGRVTNASRHQQYRVAPSWSYSVGERDLLTLGGSYSQSKYDSNSYTDFTYWQSNLQWTRIVNERLKLFLAGTYSNYRTQQQELLFQVQSYHTTSADTGFQLGGAYMFSEKLSTSVMFGRTKNKTRYDTKYSIGECNSHINTTIAKIDEQIDHVTSFEELIYLINLKQSVNQGLRPQCDMSDQDSNNLLTTVDAGLNWDSERHKLSLNVTQQTQPSSDGYTIKQMKLTGRWNYQLWERGTLNFEVTAGKNRALGGNNDNERIALQSNRTFGDSSIGYSHMLSEQWTIDCRYQYRYQRYDKRDVDASANSQAVFLGISYQPREWHWSR